MKNLLSKGGYSAMAILASALAFAQDSLSTVHNTTETTRTETNEFNWMWLLPLLLIPILYLLFRKKPADRTDNRRNDGHGTGTGNVTSNGNKY